MLMTDSFAARFLYHLCSVDSGKCDPLPSPPLSLSGLDVGDGIWEGRGGAGQERRGEEGGVAHPATRTSI